ncbi:MAG TPA: dihydroorotate dehydrogenase [Clostridia bacterium]|nr:dihydroorotate dehydrogenase [Clostridia bacterium]
MSSVDMSVNIAGLKLKNPVMTASGTFGFGEEYGEYYDLKRLGAVVVKGLTLKPRKGNPPPRTVETPAGMLNSVGLQNPGVDFFLEKELPRLLNRGACVIANISGASVDEYCLMMERLSESGVAAVELNLSCPNVKEGGIAFGIKPDLVYEVTRRVKECSQKPVIVKLSPNVTDIVEIALAAAEGGGDAVSLINTLLAMDIDINTRKPVLGNTYGGLSGPAVKPVALRMVHQVAGAVDIPVIGMGGILDWRDAVQFILAGAKAVAVGTANFVNPLAPVEIIEGIEGYAIKQGFTSVEDMVGALL